MAAVPMTQERAHARRTNLFPAWSLAAGGVLFSVGGGVHPNEDLPDASLAQQLQAMYEDPAWYPAHGAIFLGMLLITAALFALIRNPNITSVPRARTATMVTAVAGAVGTVGALVHLVAATDAHRIGHGDGTPTLSQIYLVLETIGVPLFSFSLVALAIIGAKTRTLGNWLTAVLGVVGGIGYGLAGGTAAVTPVFDFLFPTALGIGLWTIAAGIGLLRRRSASAANQ